MPRRRTIERKEAEELLHRAERDRGLVADVVLPVMEWPRRRLEGVTFRNCDVSRLGFRRRLLAPGEVVDCAFIDCSGDHHVRYHGIVFRSCRWVRSEITGSIRRCRFVDCAFESCELSSLKVDRTELGRTSFVGVAGDGLVIQDCALRAVTFAGQIRHFNLVDCRLDEVDLSECHVVDGAFLGLTGIGTHLPEFPDSFLVAAAMIASLEPELLEGVRPEVRPALRHALSSGSELEHFDRDRLDGAFADGPRLTPEEQRRVLDVLYTNRARSLEPDAR